MAHKLECLAEWVESKQVSIFLMIHSPGLLYTSNIIKHFFIRWLSPSAAPLMVILPLPGAAATTPMVHRLAASLALGSPATIMCTNGVAGLVHCCEEVLIELVCAGWLDHLHGIPYIIVRSKYITDQLNREVEQRSSVVRHGSNDLAVSSCQSSSSTLISNCIH
jgi:hypothetical protein